MVEYFSGIVEYFSDYYLETTINTASITDITTTSFVMLIMLFGFVEIKPDTSEISAVPFLLGFKCIIYSLQSLLN